MQYLTLDNFIKLALTAAFSFTCYSILNVASNTQKTKVGVMRIILNK